MGQLDGRVAIITGAGTGIGRASMRRFLHEGAMVMGVDRSQRRLEETAGLLAGKERKTPIIGVRVFLPLFFLWSGVGVFLPDLSSYFFLSIQSCLIVRCLIAEKGCSERGTS
jgi:NAD(P)-dependent dehydrogenase (short-subunit alcohol dehydrogenase family)